VVRIQVLIGSEALAKMSKWKHVMTSKGVMAAEPRLLNRTDNARSCVVRRLAAEQLGGHDHNERA
jgi:hypothetical protein